MQDVIKKEKSLGKKLLKIGQFLVFSPALIAIIFHNRFSNSELFAILTFYSLFLLLIIISFLQSRRSKKQKIIARKKGPSHTLISSLIIFLLIPFVFTIGILSLFFSPTASYEEAVTILLFYLAYNIVRFYFFLNLRSLNNKMYFFLDLAMGVSVLLGIMTNGQDEKFEFMLFTVFFTCILHYIFMPPPDAYSRKAAKKRIHNPCFVLKLYYKVFSKFFNKRQIKDAVTIIGGINAQKSDVAVIKDGINAQKSDVAVIKDGINAQKKDTAVIIDNIDTQKRFLNIITKPHGGTVNAAKKLTAVVNDQYAQNKHALIEKELGRPLPLSSKQCYALKDKFNIDIDSPLKRVKRETLIQALEYILGYKINDDHFKKLRKGIDQQGRKTYNSLSLCQIISNESTAFDKNI